jgi:hypothetical protein
MSLCDGINQSGGRGDTPISPVAQANFLTYPTTNKSITAPITALTIAAMTPPTITNPIIGKSQPAMIDPTIPTIMLPTIPTHSPSQEDWRANPQRRQQRAK